MKRICLVVSLCVLALAAVTMGAAEVRAHGALDPDVERRSAALAAAQGVDAYAALRELWRAWEVADPLQVEAALAAVAEDPRRPPPVRAYARLLHAYARLRRGDLHGARSEVAELGFVKDWLVVGPFANDNKTGLGARFVPELELAEPIVFDRSFNAMQRAVRWRVSPDVHPYGWVDLGALVRPRRDVCVLGTTFVKSTLHRKHPARDVTLWAGSAGALKLYWNDQEVLVDDAYRSLDADRQSVVVTLSEGFNRLTAKVCADESSPALSVRIGELDGSPAADLQVAADQQASTLAAAGMRARRTAQAAAKTAAKKARQGKAAEGPLQLLDRQLVKGAKDPRVLERYARYLLITGGEPEGSHKAELLARAAITQEPTVARLLLAASTSRDRNTRRTLVDRAAKLAQGRDERIECTVARAGLLRTGLDWREAVPLYDDVLAVEPDHAEALLGKVDLYVEAGLSRTALATLRAAALRRPRSVALLRAMAGQLRALGRDTDALEVESRYAALRFDDAGLIKDRIDVAVARRDQAAARRWGRRLIDSEPASTWAHGVVARAERALGDAGAAARSYERALAIAPDDLATLRELSDLRGTTGRRDLQVALLERILRLQPQAKAVRAYLEHIVPSTARDDEKYAWPAERFLEQRAVSGESGDGLRVLRQLTVTTVHPSGLASHFKQIVFQPLTKRAAIEARQYAFVYHADRQVVQLRATKVYRRDGRVDESAVTGETAANDPSINMYTLQRTFYVQLPRLEAGDVVELRYRVEDVAARNEMSDTFGEVEYLQGTDPIASVEYVLSTPKSRTIHLSSSKTLPGLQQEVKEVGDRRVHRVFAKDVPALAVEPRMPPLGELAAHVHASTFDGWGAVGKWYWELAREKLDVDEHIRSKAKELAAGAKTVRDKVAAVYRYAATGTRYVALELGIEGIRPRRAALTLARGWGDCKDKATLIVSLLKELGVDAELVLVRTGLRGGFDTTTASLAPFDHAIVYVPSLDLYLDGTAEQTGSGELPIMDRGSVALRIKRGDGELVRLPDPPASASVERREVDLTVDKKGDLTFGGRIEVSGAFASSWRQRYASENTRRERVGADLAAVLGPVELSSGKKGLSVSDLDAIEQPVVLHVAGSASAMRDGRAWSVPMGSEPALVSRFAAGATRVHPLLLGPRRALEQRYKLTLPANMRTMSLPKATKRATKFGSYEIAVTTSGRSVEVHTRLQLDVSRVAPADYPAWRRFCQAVDAASTPRALVGE